MIEKLAFACLALGFFLVTASLAFKSVMPGPRGQVALSAGDEAEIEGRKLVLEDFRVPKYPSGKARPSSATCPATAARPTCS